MDIKDIQISDELFIQMTRYTNAGDNYEYNIKRGEALGLGGRNIRVAPGCIIRVTDPNKLGSNLFLGLYAYINGDITIGDNVLIGPHCCLTAGHHKFDPATGWFSGRTEQDFDNSIVIGEGSWLASNVTVTAGVKIGKCNLVCAGAVVTHDTEDYAIMAGIPARKKGYIDPVTGESVWDKED